MKILKKGYTENYFSTIADNKFFKEIETKRKARIISSIKSSGNLLEIGCGQGILLKELKKFYNVYGADISSSAIKQTSKFIDLKKLRVLNIENKKISGKYDIIIAFDLLEHLKNPEKCIVKIKNLLKKRGVFILSVPNNYGLYGKLMTRLFNYIDKTHISAYSREKWIDILERSFKLDIRNQDIFWISKLEIAKYFSSNLFVIATKK